MTYRYILLYYCSLYVAIQNGKSTLYEYYNRHLFRGFEGLLPPRKKLLQKYGKNYFLWGAKSFNCPRVVHKIFILHFSLKS